MWAAESLVLSVGNEGKTVIKRILSTSPMSLPKLMLKLNPQCEVLRDGAKWDL
jgi:hypothetical protein